LAAALAIAGCRAESSPDAVTANGAGNRPTELAQIDAQRLNGLAAVTPVAVSTVTLQGFAFVPQVIMVPVGTTVTWTNQDIEQHTVTARDRSFDSDALESRRSFAFTFSKAGAYDFRCVIHPSMVGRVIVAGG
jgi:plastocyanin